MTMSDHPTSRTEDQEPTGKACPICGRPGLVRFRPFCSSRCADVDLGRWFTGRYAIPAESSGEDDVAEDEPLAADRQD